MPAEIKRSEIRWVDPVQIKFGFTGLASDYAVPIIREMLKDQWPEIRRPSQCVYVVRLRGEVAVSYGERHSPVIYIGEGNAYGRIYSHVNWISSLLVSVPNMEIEVQIAEIARRNHTSLCEYIEADMIRWFHEDIGALPWFNRQRERSKEKAHSYEHEAESSLRRRLGVGSGSSFLWAIRPTQINDQYAPYGKGSG